MKNYHRPLIAFVTLVLLSVNFTVVEASQSNSAISSKVMALTSGYKYDASRIIVKYKQKPTQIDQTQMMPLAIDAKGQADKSFLQPLQNYFVVNVKQLDGMQQAVGLADTNAEISTIQNKLAELLADPNVEYAIPNYASEPLAWSAYSGGTVPGDYDTNATGGLDHWYYTSGNLPEMWSAQSCSAGANCGGDSNVIVAVIDTGVAFETYDDSYTTGCSNPLYENAFYCVGNGATWNGGYSGVNYAATATEIDDINLWTNSGEVAGDFKDNDCNGVIDDVNGIDTYAFWELAFLEDTCPGGIPADYSAATDKWAIKAGHPVDTYGHGTFVTGNIASEIDNAAGSVSPAFDVTIMPISASVTDNTYGEWGLFYDIDVITAILYAANYGANVINLSLGGAAYDPAFQDFISSIVDAGVTVVAASGNGGDDGVGDAVSYPAAYDNVIAVGAVNANNTRTTYSNYGSNLDLVAYVGQGAGGNNDAVYQQSLSCFWTANACEPGDSYASVTTNYAVGTSFAAPQVAAAAALIIGNNPGITSDLVTLGLTNSTTDINGTGWDTQTGNGVLDFQKANSFNDDTVYKTYFPNYSNNNTNKKNWIIVGNPDEANTIPLQISVGETFADYAVLVGPDQRVSPTFDILGDGPVVVTSTQPIYATNKQNVDGSINEYAGISTTDFGTTIYFPNYSDNGNDKRNWIIVGNPQSTNTTVDIYIGGVQVVTDAVLVPDQRLTTSLPMLGVGPVKIVATQAVYATNKQNVNGSVNEYAGVSSTNFGTTIYFPNYSDNGNDKRNWIIVGNPQATNTTVDVFIGGVQVANDVVLSPDERLTTTVPMVGVGPVKITASQPVYATNKQNVNGSINEYAGTASNNFGTTTYFPNYSDNAADKRNWIIVGNPQATNTTVDIFIGGVQVASNVVLSPDERLTTTVQMLGVGPVKIVGSQAVYATNKQNVSGSINEYFGISP